MNTSNARVKTQLSPQPGSPTAVYAPGPLALPAVLCVLMVSGCMSTGGGKPKTPVAASARSAQVNPVVTLQPTSMPLVRPETLSGAMHADDTAVVSDAPASGGSMEVCLFEAEQLSRLGNASQKGLVAGLYRNIRAAQVYSPMAQKLSPGTASTVTPLYEYAVNDACNSVNQALLSVLKKQVPVSGGGRD